MSDYLVSGVAFLQKTQRFGTALRINRLFKAVANLEYSFMFVNLLRPRHNGRHFPDDIFKRVFLNENV